MSLGRKRQGMEGRRQGIRTLVLGSSHADYGFLGSAAHGYNLGLPSADLYTVHRLYSEVGNSLPELENVVLFFSVFMPGYSLIRTREKYRCVAYRHFFGIEYQDAARLEPDTEAAILKDCACVPGDQPIGEYWGYEQRPFFFAPASARAQTHLRENRREPDQMEWLRRTMELARSRRHGFYLVLPPARSDYRAGLPDHRDLFRKLHRLDSDSYRLVDFYSSSVFDDHHMGDPDHMNRFGALKLARELSRITGTAGRAGEEES